MSTTTTGDVLRVDDLHVYYGAIHALKGVSLRVGTGEIVTLIGANGAGKSTTLRAINGLNRPRQGSIRFEGRDITMAPPHEIVGGGGVAVHLDAGVVHQHDELALEGRVAVVGGAGVLVGLVDALAAAVDAAVDVDHPVRGEEGGEALRRKMDDTVALDRADPPSHVAIERSEQAELHSARLSREISPVSKEVRQTAARAKPARRLSRQVR